MIQVLMKDSNVLYHQGMRLFIADFFRVEHAREVEFLAEYNEGNIAKADVIIIELRNGEYYTCFQELKGKRNGLVIGIMDEDVPPPAFLPYCMRDTIFISRRDSLLMVRRKLRQGWSFIKYALSTNPFASCSGCRHKVLSKTELAVMADIYLGNSVNTIAARMALQPKTIYAHKYSVMHKFNLRSDYELVALLKSLSGKNNHHNYFQYQLDICHKHLHAS